MFARAGGCPIGVIDRPDPVPTGAILLLVVVVVVLTEAAGATVGIKLEVDLAGAWIGAGSCCDGAAAAAVVGAATVWVVVADDDDTVEDETEVVLVMLVSTLLLVLLLLADAADELLPNGAGSPLAGDCRICTGGRMVAGALAVADEEMLLGALLEAGV